MSLSPISVTYRHLDKSPSVTSRAVDLVRKLWRLNDKIRRCQVTIEGRGAANSSPATCVVKLDLELPGAQVHVQSEQVISHSTQNHMYVALREAVNDARQQLLQLAQRRGRERIEVAVAAQKAVNR